MKVKLIYDKIRFRFEKDSWRQDIKGGLVKETLMYKFSPYSKFEFSHQRTESQAFVLVFVRKTEFLTAKLPVTQKPTEKDSS